MKKLLTLLLSFQISLALAQNDDIILKAMRDELDRSMKELSMQGMDKPFYIAYTLDDRMYYSIVAQMGSHLRTNIIPERLNNVRLLVGDYSFNDESLDSNGGANGSGNDVSLPVDNDYFGIRRAFWSMTDDVYKGAARQYKQNQQALAEKKKPLTEMPHRTFAKFPAATIYETGKPVSAEIKHLEEFASATSAEFLKFSDLENSLVYVTIADGYRYFVNSEGTIARTPLQMSTLYATVSYKTAQGETLHDELVYFVTVPSEFPSQEKIKSDIDQLYQRVKAKEKYRLLDDDYQGPVLLVGTAVGNFFLQALAEDPNLLFASDMLPNPKRRFVDEDDAMDSKLNKQLIHESLNLKAKPKLKVFQGVALLGSYSIDDDGVIPPDEISLIENGVLKNQLNDRSLLKPNEVPNGHSNGLSVLEVSAKNGVALSVLKQRLIDRAKSDGLSYALMVSVPPGSDESNLVFTKVNVKDGSEEIVRGAEINYVLTKDLKKIGGATERLAANNITSSERVVSIIAPEGMLINSLDVKKTSPVFFKEEEYITNPVVE